MGLLPVPPARGNEHPTPRALGCPEALERGSAPSASRPQLRPFADLHGVVGSALATPERAWSSRLHARTAAKQDPGDALDEVHDRDARKDRIHADGA